MYRLRDDEAEIMAKAVLQPLTPMLNGIGVAKYRLDPDFAARADLDRTSRHIICPQVERAAARQFEARMSRGRCL